MIAIRLHRRHHRLYHHHHHHHHRMHRDRRRFEAGPLAPLLSSRKFCEMNSLLPNFYRRCARLSVFRVSRLFRILPMSDRFDLSREREISKGDI